MQEYHPKEIEAKWQKEWERSCLYHAKDKSEKEKYYALIEFPYPSGDGLHVGHPRPYIGIDVIARKRRMQGFNVLYPIGWDAFGLPTENFAIKTGKNPHLVTKENSDTFRRQIKSLGISFDWSREINTSDPAYYRWTQWLFLKFLEHDLAYKAKIPINWCPKDKIGLANEEVVDGKCERCGTPVEQKEKEQWMLKITAYAEKLLNDLDTVDYPERVKAQQRNWIGKSEGALIKFDDIEVFTTRPDTLFGATFIAVSGKEDKFTGKYVTNPATQEKIPVWEAQYILADYGTGAIMGVPAHDERDFEFAKKHDIEIKSVIEPLYITETGPDAVHKKEEFQKRETVVCIVKHWAEDKYICLDWKNYGWKTFVVGGLDGDTVEDAARKEILEETGYKSIKSIRRLGGRVHNQFYARHKNVNRWAVINPVLVELADGEQEPVHENERGLHEVKWMPKNEVASFLFDDASDQIFWRRAQGLEESVSQPGFLINSKEFDGMSSVEAKKEVSEKFGTLKTSYKLRDWVFSRQRYWGEPIPVIHCEKCGIVPVPEKDLPVKLPEVTNYQPTDTGESPLANISEWVNVSCPKCGGAGKRETDVMPNWAGSSWYFLRYLDPNNDQAFAGPEKLKHWMPVDWYNGGMEHTVLHLLYSRFWNKFFFDIGLVPVSEPYKKRTSHGLILAEGGVKMSKSLGNVINPDSIVKQFGADTLRLYEMFMGPFEQAIAWNESSLLGPRRFLEKVWRLGPKISNSQFPISNEFSMHQCIKRVSEDIETLGFNTAVSSLMIYVNELDKKENVSKVEYETLLKLLAPFAPHMAEELWQSLGNGSSIHTERWPEHDEKKMLAQTAVIAVQVNGKVRASFEASASIGEEEAVSRAKAMPEVQKWVGESPIKKAIYVPGKLVSLVI